MTIIVFLIDTSASMNQRAYLGGRPTLLDVAKSAVETFVKVRQNTSFLAFFLFSLGSSLRVVSFPSFAPRSFFSLAVAKNLTIFTFRSDNDLRRVEAIVTCS